MGATTGAEENPYFETIAEVPRLTRPTRDEFARAHYGPKKPVIIAGALEKCRALGRWTPDYLEQTAGTRRVPIEYTLRPIYMVNPKLNKGRYFRKDMEFGRSLTLIRAQQQQRQYYYASDLSIPHLLPELAADIQAPDLIDPRYLQMSLLFLGNDKTGSQLHYDITENLLAVFAGRKRVILLAPNETSRLYPFSPLNPLCHYSRVDLMKPDPKKFPRCRQLRAHACVVEPGELLYIPHAWWHYVSNEGLTIGVSFVYHAPLSQTILWRHLRVILASVLTRMEWPRWANRTVARWTGQA